MHKVRSQLGKLQNLTGEGVSSSLSQGDLEENGLQGIQLRSYQLEGVRWMKRSLENGQGCILADEMGLGKTIQTIALLIYLQGVNNCPGPFLIVCPLSVLQNWQNEFSRFSKHQVVLSFIGDKDEREEIKNSVRIVFKSQNAVHRNESLSFHVLLTTYEMCLRETTFLSKFHWKAMIVDEAHRLKNSRSSLYQELSQFEKDFVVLLTGTPVQNNLNELYSLLSFVSPDIFTLDAVEEFVEQFTNVDNSDTSTELQNILSPFLLRRVKSEVMVHLPRKTEVLLYTGMTDLQKRYYKAILLKDLDAFNSASGFMKTRLMNILIQLRKCINHPYLFDGVEPEPFELGEHLVDASGKLRIIDQLLIFLKARGHKVLMFSQMTRMLDIIQDYLGYRGYSYERLDGSVRGEERYLAIQNFNETEDTFIFLLSTRAGGQGLNLMSADTVIFVDSDFNPQNDLQAAARAHRIGQTRPVKVIRLVARSTVEEIVLKRADDKLKLTNSVIEGGKFSGNASALNQIAETPTQLADLLKYGLDKLFDSDERTLTEEDLEKILGESFNNEWTVGETRNQSNLNKDVIVSCMETDDGEKVSDMYVYEGHDYRETTVKDQEAFDNMMADMLEESQTEERLLRSERKGSVAHFVDLPMRKRKILSPEELEERKKKREENAAKRAKLKEEEESRKERDRQTKLEKLWKDADYSTLNIANGEEEDEDETKDSFDEEDEREQKDIRYVRGDVTHPIKICGSDAIIIHCVDDSGRWGQGGLFSALSRRSTRPETQYELANRMKDLKLGDAHLVPLDDRRNPKDGHEYVALIVAQSRDRQNRLSGIKLTSLSLGLKRIALAAKKMKATIHLPRIGYNTPSFNWYGTERLLRKHLVCKGIQTSVYYFDRQSATNNSKTLTSLNADSLKKRSYKAKDKRETSKDDESSHGEHRKSTKHSLPDFMYGVNVLFHNVEETHRKQLTRYLVAYNGDVSHIACGDVTHVVTCDDSDQYHSSQELNDDVKVVSSKWLESCFRKRRIQETAPYEKQRKEKN
ncbi:chromodomain-helicase-DNA-binding protein 1-like isoform X2 [Pocillopora damicornis]|uniref:chromodomain-helicase-DNA-binding protein 1-like isoform X2 n=1 Tax=Pocillopora damicornis TaxID=46731 RepID=UPI000F5528C4|nr:chromodomain-helicase-DNA-binding protein 1-like isoform X2 [Pocillopora damicornis]